MKRQTDKLSITSVKLFRESTPEFNLRVLYDKLVVLAATSDPEIAEQAKSAIYLINMLRLRNQERTLHFVVGGTSVITASIIAIDRFLSLTDPAKPTGIIGLALLSSLLGGSASALVSIIVENSKINELFQHLSVVYSALNTRK